MVFNGTKQLLSANDSAQDQYQEGNQMTAGKYCNREVVVTESGTTINEVAKLMREHHVGDLVVIRKEGDQNIPIGIITDRDLVVGVLAQDIPTEAITLRDVMSAGLITVTEEHTLLETLATMKEHGIRRIVVVNGDGGLEGILTADDAIELISEAMNSLVQLVKRELSEEAQRHP